MADSVVINDANGEQQPISTEDIANAQLQRIKLVIGDLNTDGGDVATDNPMPVTLATALSEAIDSVLTYPRGSNYFETSASALVLTGQGKLTGVFVAGASSTPTIKFWDGVAASTADLIDTFTPSAATMYTFPPIRVLNGIYITISGTVTCTVFYDPTVT